MLKDVQLIAHRGASTYAPENTLAAFNKAEAMGARWIEFDVMLSEDGEAFVFHDETLERTTNGKGRFGLVAADYIRTLDAGSWYSSDYCHERVPLLQEALAWFASRDVQANIEIKPYSGKTHETTLAVLSHLHLYWPQGKPYPLVSSFDVDALRLCRAMMPELPLALLLNTWREDAIALLSELNAVSVNLSRRLVTQMRVEQLKQHGFAVCVYTVNRKREAQRYLEWGVNAVFSNDPCLLFESKLRVLLKKILDKRNRVA